MLKKTLIGTATMALLFGAFAAPAAGVDPAPARVLLVDGLPGRHDICFGRTEAVSNLRFGRAVFWSELTPGAYRFVIRRARRGRCTGGVLGVVTRRIAPGANTSLVIWKPARRVTIRQYENDISLPSADSATVSVRHVARKPAFIHVWLWQQVHAPATHDGPTIRRLPKSGTSKPILVPPGQYSADVFASRRTPFFDWAGFWSTADPGTTTDLYLIGTSKRNYRVVGFEQDGVVVGP